jgi:prophage maintenance system killer protein
MENGLDINANQSEKYNFVIGIASGKLSHEMIVAWILDHTVK